MRQFKNGGLTIIELVVVIVVLGLAIPPLLTSWANIGWRSVRSESLADATFYVQALMEEIKSKSFDENSSSPWSSSLGPESGESRTGTGASAYDDVDDYIISNGPLPNASGYTSCDRRTSDDK